MPDVITVLFNCRACGLSKIPVEVIRRGSLSMAEWMQHVSSQVAVKHVALSPSCTHDRVDLLIPIPKLNEGIGDSVADPKDMEARKAMMEAVNRVNKADDNSQ